MMTLIEKVNSTPVIPDVELVFQKPACMMGESVANNLYQSTILL